ncbi:hypothetical protein ACMA1I_20195 [Pontibacter sp. 13R65]|uniref:hypothetical protein n=1 Tax=Pontibacter sp. 13R65 TaxID=3127458 RepID=UPI00301DB1CA
MAWAMHQQGRRVNVVLAYVVVQKKLLVLIYTLWKRDEAWQENKYQGPEADPQKVILSLEVGASLSGVCAADQNKVARQAGLHKMNIPHLSARSSLPGKRKI